MRYFEIANGFRVPVWGEEQTVLNKVDNGLPETDITDEGDQELVQHMLQREILKKFRDKSGKIIYKKNSANSILMDRDK